MKPKLLIVDDQPESIELCTLLIRSFLPEYDVVSALDGPGGLRLARSETPEAVVLDVKMPGMDGFEVCRRLKSEPATREIPVLLISGVLIGPNHRVEGLDAGAEGYLYKPFEPQEFIAQVRSLLRIKRLTDQLRARERALESDLRQREEQYRSLVETAPFAVLLVQNGRIVFANRAAPAMLDHAGAGTLADRDPLDLAVSGERAALRERLARSATAGGPPAAVETALRRTDGSEFPVEEYMADTVFAGMPARQIIWIDISRRRAAETALRASQEKLQQSQRMDALGRLSGGVAHDFNNLLTSIIGYTHMLREEEGLPAHVKTDLDEILHASERAEHLVRHLLAFSRNQPVEMAPIDLNEVVMGMDRLLRRTLGADIELVTLPGENLGSVMADAGQIEQVVMNLAVNARAAMPQGGKLTIRTKRHPARIADGNGAVCDSVLLEVSDTGCGMTPEVRKQAFEPFFTTRPRGEGTGLGLSTVYGIVQQCAGRIDLESAPGRGVRFRIYLPRFDVPPVRMEIGQESDLPTGDEAILLVEDEPSLRRLTARYLRAQGYEVIEATNGQDGLDAFLRNSGRVDLVLTDVVMPRMNGPDMVRRIRETSSRVPVLFITGFIRNTRILDGDRPADVLLKPFTRRTLACRIRDRLDVRDSQPG